MRHFLVTFFFILFKINLIAQFTLNVGSLPSSCLNNGKLYFYVSGQAAGSTLEYNIYNIPGNVFVANTTSNVYSGLAPGSYKVEAIQNLNGQSSVQIKNIDIANLYNSIDYNVSTISENCGNDAKIMINPLPATNFATPFRYDIISGPITKPKQLSNQFNNLVSGMYRVRVSDTCGEAKAVNVLVGQNTNFMSNYLNNYSNTTIFNCDSGSFIVHPLSSSFSSYPYIRTITFKLPEGGLFIYSDTIFSGDWSNKYVNFPRRDLPQFQSLKYTFDITIKDNCNNIYNYPNKEVPRNNKSTALGILPSFCDKKFIRISNKNLKYPIQIQFIQNPIGFVPSNFNSSHPNFTNPFDINYGGINNNLPEGIYKYRIIDACGDTLFNERNLVNSLLELTSGSNNITCTNSAIFINSSMLSLDSVVILDAPQNYKNLYNLPRNRTSKISMIGSWTDTVLSKDFVSGQYVFYTKDTCGHERLINVSVDKIDSIAIQMNQIKMKCNNQLDFNLDLKYYSNGEALSLITGNQNDTLRLLSQPNGGSQHFILQSNNNQIQFDKKAPGVYNFQLAMRDTNYLTGLGCVFNTQKSFTLQPFKFDTVSQYLKINCANVDLSFSYSATYPVRYRIWKKIQNNWGNVGLNVAPFIDTNQYLRDSFLYSAVYFHEGTYRITAETDNMLNCPKTVWEFDIVYPYPKINGISSWKCNNSYNLVVEASGSDSLYYSISSPFFLDNLNNSLFTSSSITSGLYNFRVSDNCGNITNRLLQIPNISNIISPRNICPGLHGTLILNKSLGKNKNLKFQWWKDGNFSNILSTSDSLFFQPFNPLLHNGTYYVRIYSSDLNQLCSDTIKYVLNSNIPPTAGADTSVSFCFERMLINLSNFITSSASKSGKFKHASNILNISETGFLDLNTAPTGIHNVMYIVDQFCGIKDTSWLQLNIIPQNTIQVNNCPKDTILYGCPQPYSWPHPIFLNNCQTFSYNVNLNPGHIFEKDTTNIFYQSIGFNGEKGYCSFNVFLKDTIKPLIVFCPNDTILLSEIGKCGAKSSWKTPEFLDNCSLPLKINASHNSDTFLNVGINLITYLVSDFQKNQSICQFKINVKDQESPRFTKCPDTIRIRFDSGICRKPVLWQPPILLDNCPNAIIESSHKPLDTFGEGITHVIYTATDVSGNKDTCVFVVFGEINKTFEAFDTICFNQTYLFKNRILTESGIYTETFLSVSRCDSIVNLHLFKKDTASIIIFDTTCENEPVFFNNQWISKKGHYRDTFLGANACDSFVNYFLHIKDTSHFHIYDSTCINTPKFFAGKFYNAPGTYLDTLKNRFQCDSFIFYHLHIKDTSSKRIRIEFCIHDSIFLKNTWHYDSKIVKDTLINKYGCDSFVYYQLFKLPQVESLIHRKVCKGASYEGYNKDGTYIDTFKKLSYKGCDSIRTLNVEFVQFYDIYSKHICYPNSYLNHTEPGIYYDTFTDNLGCIVFREVNLSVHFPDTLELWDTVCYNESKFGYLSSGIYIDHILNDFGCDRTRILHLTVRDKLLKERFPDTALCDGNQIVIMENSNFFMYTWNSGQTTSFIEINQPGIYSLKVMDQNKCVDFDTFLVTFYENPLYKKNITYNFNENQFDINIETDSSNSIKWMPYEDIFCHTCIDQIIKPKEELFWLYFTIQNKFECVSYDSLMILSQDSVVGFVAFPNAFSPNGDFRNENYGPMVKNVKTIQWRIYDKIGQMIFWSDSPNHFWDGRYKDEPCMNNLYIWTCDVTFNNGKTERLKGEVYLMR